MSTDRRNSLDYAPPEPLPRIATVRRFAACCLSVLLGLLGMPFLIQGIIAAVHGFQEPHRFWRSDDSSAGMISLGIGAFCVIVAIRWGWHAFRQPTDR
jgi:uncharacterized membrane protein HdeD (DUF308 family)